MKSVAIICEYNPFHLGHAYHAEQARKFSGADAVVGIMSGHFVQRAEPSCLGVGLRTEVALRSGVDCIIQMPAIFSSACGNIFARGAVDILSKIPSVKYLAMGVEDDGELITQIAHVQSLEAEAFISVLKSELNSGASYPAAITKATAKNIKTMSEEKCADILSKPNNVLAIEYLKEIFSRNLDITLLFVRREGNNYNDESVSGRFISATAARKLMREGDFTTLSKYLPSACFEIVKEEVLSRPVNMPVYEALVIQSLRNRAVKAYDAEEGLSAKMSENADKYCSLERILSETKSKRYTMSRLRRACVQSLLGIDEGIMALSPYAKGKLIGIKESMRGFIKELPDIAVKNKDFYCDERTAEVAKIDAKAAAVHALITGRCGNEFTDSRLITI